MPNPDENVLPISRTGGGDPPGAAKTLREQSPVRRSRTEILRRAAALLWLLLGPMFMLWPLWQMPTAAGEDDLIYYFPLRVLVGKSLAAHQWPTWNPYEQCGAPLAADPQAAVQYPPTWLFCLLPPKTAYSLNVFIAFALAGLGVYLYLRRLGLSLLAAVFGATVFQYCGFMIGHRVHLSMICTAAMLGWGLWAIERMQARPRGSVFVFAGIVYLALASGHWPIFIFTAICWLAYLLVRGRPLAVSLGAAAGGAAMAVFAMSPQIISTLQLMAASTRQHVGFALAGENSFPPTNIILAFFPLIMGCRTPNKWVEYAWWGPWHLCETLGYVGLITLVLACCAAWRLWRKDSGGRWSGLVKLWTIFGLAAFVLMLGYYFPPVFALVHKLPVLGVIRAPARWLEVLDLSLAVLAAIGLEVLIHPSPLEGEGGTKCRVRGVGLEEPSPLPLSRKRERGEEAPPGELRMAQSLRRGVLVFLPMVMISLIGLTALLTAIFQRYYPDKFGQPFVGGPAQVWRSLRPDNTAFWMPLALLAITCGVMVLFLRNPRRRGVMILAMAIFDLLIVTRAVDMPAVATRAADPANSLMADFLKGDAGGEPFRVLHLTNDYFVQPVMSLAPKTSAVFGVENLAGYGPFQTGEYAHLFGLRIFGYTRDWAWLVRRNYLLSLYNVRYILCQEQFRSVVESVVIPDPGEQAISESENLLGDKWRLERASQIGQSFVFDKAYLLWPATAAQDVWPSPGQVYRIELSARRPRARTISCRPN